MIWRLRRALRQPFALADDPERIIHIVAGLIEPPVPP